MLKPFSVDTFFKRRVRPRHASRSFSYTPLPVRRQVHRGKHFGFVLSILHDPRSVFLDGPRPLRFFLFPREGARFLEVTIHPSPAGHTVPFLKMFCFCTPAIL